MSRRALLLFLAVGVAWGIPYYFIAVANHSFSTPSIVWLRVTIGAAILLPIVIMRGDLKKTLTNWRGVLLFATLEMVGPWYLITEAGRTTASSFAGLMMTTIPFIAAFITGTFLGDRAARHPATITGLILGFVGVFALVGIDAVSGVLEIGPVMMLAVSAVCYAVAPIVAGRTMPSVSGLSLSAVALGMVSIIYAPFAAFTLPADIARAPSLDGWIAILVLGVVSSAVAFVLFFALIKDVGPRRATLITYLNLLVAAVLGIVFLDEPLTAGILIGLPLVVAGSYLAGRDRSELQKTPRSSTGRGRTGRSP
jgi:drug/metabolite transporter (DMT)-like permease